MTAAPKRPGAKAEPVQNPGVVTGDEVYFRHPSGPHAAKVMATGRHGITVHHEKKPHKVRWEHVLGHKTRKSQKYDVVDEGEDGLIVKDAAGQRRYITVPPEARGEKMVLEKAFGAGVGRLVVFAKGGLALQAGTGDGGGAARQMVRKKNALPKGDDAGGYGPHNLKAGDRVSFTNGEHSGEGQVHAVGAHGAVVRDGADGEHRVLHEHITGHTPAKSAASAAPDATAKENNNNQKKSLPKSE